MNTELLQEAVEYRLISLLLMPPEEAWEEEIRALASEVRDPELRSAASAACLEADKALYHTLLGPGGRLSPRAVTYNSGLNPGGMMAQLKGFYEAFAYSPGVKEPPDHVGVMAGFVAYLKVKEALGRPRQARTAQQASLKFIQEHLDRPASLLAQDLVACGISYLSSAARALLRKLAQAKEAARQKEKTIA